MICAILYLENSDKARFYDLKKSVGNDNVTNKAECPRTVTTVHSFLLNYQHNYNSNRNSQSNRVRNQLMFGKRRKTREGKGYKKQNEQRPRRNLEHITCNNCEEKGHYAGNSELSTQIKLKQDSEAFSRTKQEKSNNKPPGGGDQKALVNVKDSLCNLMMGSPTE